MSSPSTSRRRKGFRCWGEHWTRNARNTIVFIKTFIIVFGIIISSFFFFSSRRRRGSRTRRPRAAKETTTISLFARRTTNGSCSCCCRAVVRRPRDSAGNLSWPPDRGDSRSSAVCAGLYSCAPGRPPHAVRDAKTLHVHTLTHPRSRTHTRCTFIA